MVVPVVGRLFQAVARRLRAADDERNARRLARHLGVPLPEARRLYGAARERGYGAAYEDVIEGRRRRP